MPPRAASTPLRSTPSAPVAVAASWTFLTNHAHVLIVLSREGDLTMRDVADRVGITERAVQRIVAELVEGGYLSVVKEGRRNQYTVNDRLALRHDVEAHRTVADLLLLAR
jgi:DNA-binding IclR family transcriptional regulator